MAYFLPDNVGQYKVIFGGKISMETPEVILI